MSSANPDNTSTTNGVELLDAIDDDESHYDGVYYGESDEEDDIDVELLMSDTNLPANPEPFDILADNGGFLYSESDRRLYTGSPSLDMMSVEGRTTSPLIFSITEEGEDVDEEDHVDANSLSVASVDSSADATASEERGSGEERTPRTEETFYARPSLPPPSLYRIPHGMYQQGEQKNNGNEYDGVDYGDSDDEDESDSYNNNDIDNDQQSQSTASLSLVSGSIKETVKGIHSVLDEMQSTPSVSDPSEESYGNHYLDDETITSDISVGGTTMLSLELDRAKDVFLEYTGFTGASSRVQGTRQWKHPPMSPGAVTTDGNNKRIFRVAFCCVCLAILIGITLAFTIGSESDTASNIRGNDSSSSFVPTVAPSNTPDAANNGLDADSIVAKQTTAPTIPYSVNTTTTGSQEPSMSPAPSLRPSTRPTTRTPVPTGTPTQQTTTTTTTTTTTLVPTGISQEAASAIPTIAIESNSSKLPLAAINENISARPTATPTRNTKPTTTPVPTAFSQEPSLIPTISKTLEDTSSELPIASIDENLSNRPSISPSFSRPSRPKDDKNEKEDKDDDGEVSAKVDAEEVGEEDGNPAGSLPGFDGDHNTKPWDDDDFEPIEVHPVLDDFYAKIKVEEEGGSNPAGSFPGFDGDHNTNPWDDDDFKPIEVQPLDDFYANTGVEDKADSNPAGSFPGWDDDHKTKSWGDDDFEHVEVKPVLDDFYANDDGYYDYERHHPNNKAGKKEKYSKSDRKGMKYRKNNPKTRGETTRGYNNQHYPPSLQLQRQWRPLPTQLSQEPYVAYSQLPPHEYEQKEQRKYSSYWGYQQSPMFPRGTIKTTTIRIRKVPRGS